MLQALFYVLNLIVGFLLDLIKLESLLVLELPELLLLLPLMLYLLIFILLHNGLELLVG